MILVVCGLKAEADLVAGNDAKVVCGGGDQTGLAADLARLAPAATAILSFGVAGGLDPSLRPGDLRVASMVLGPSGSRYETDVAWTARLTTLLDVPSRPFAAVDSPLADVAGKSALFAATNAATVDMESHVAAFAAHAARKPFAAIRAVTDPAGRSLPHAATVGMRADGAVDLRAVLASLMKKPGQLPGLIQTGLDARKAFAALLRGRQLLGPGFAFLDLG